MCGTYSGRLLQFYSSALGSYRNYAGKYGKYLEREEILHNSPGEDVVVEAISFPEGIYTSGAGEITSDAEHWINIGVSDYYGVKSVRTE